MGLWLSALFLLVNAGLFIALDLPEIERAGDSGKISALGLVELLEINGQRASCVVGILSMIVSGVLTLRRLSQSEAK